MSFSSLISEIITLDQNQLSQDEYRYVVDLILEKRGANVLVFGVGNDSRLWLAANRKGRTLFLEDSSTWLDKVIRQVPAIEVTLVRYGTRRSQWREMLEGPPSDLEMKLPDEVWAIAWDIIFVDAPWGFNDICPGRMKSIYTASKIASCRAGIDVIVHDCDRELERAYCDRFLSSYILIREFQRTRHYRT